MKLIYKYIIFKENLKFNKYLDFEDDVEKFEYDLEKNGFNFVRVVWVKRY